MSRFFSTEPARTVAVFAAVLTIAQAVWLGGHGGGWPSGDEWLGMGSTLATAVISAGWLRSKVTPVADPKTRGELRRLLDPAAVTGYHAGGTVYAPADVEIIMKGDRR